MKALVLMLLLGITNSYALEIPSHFFGEWVQQDRGYREVDIIKIGSDMTFSQETTRQVGRSGKEISFPTICRYLETGTIEMFQRISHIQNKQYADHGKPYGDYTLDFKINKVELIQTPENDQKCERFVELSNQAISDSGGDGYSMDIKDLSDNIFMKPWFSDVFLKSSEEKSPNVLNPNDLPDSNH